MALSKLFKKTSAPDELPDLAIDELKKDLKKDYSEKEEKKSEVKKEEKSKPKEETRVEEEKEEVEKTPESNQIEEKKEEVEETPPQTNKDKKESKPEEKTSEDRANLEKSFFNPLLDELKRENFDPAKVNSWYQKRFSEKGAIEEMKEYWEKQKDEFISETVEKEFRSRINERMILLQKLESEWQQIYISLIEKEEEMKKEEKNIKKTIEDFSKVFKKKGNLKKEPKVE